MPALKAKSSANRRQESLGTSLFLPRPASPRPHTGHRPVEGTDCHLSAPSRHLIGSPGRPAPFSARRPPPAPLGAPTAAGGTERAGAALPLSAGGPPSLLPSLPSPSPLPSSGPRVVLPHAPSLAERSPVRAFLVPQAAGRARPCSMLAVPARSVPPFPGARGSQLPCRPRLGDPAGLRRRRTRQPERTAGLDPELRAASTAPSAGPTHPGSGHG